ncbi:MAG: PAS domain-containing protein, partial [Desulfovermiculus sp.]|nr:PAS domain-containing protein [Desulfovermiculus sp.]
MSEKKITKDQPADTHLEEQSRQLQERTKELNCLYALASLFADQSIPQTELLQKVVELIPPSWQYPEITCARLVWQGQEYRTQNFQETSWQQTSDILLQGAKTGYVQVCYLEERPAIHEGPFLKEEGDLLNALANNLSHYLEAKQIEREKDRSEEFNRAIIQSSPLPIFSLDLEGNVLTWNAAAEQVMGWERSAVVGNPLPIVPEDKQGEFRDLMQHVALEGGFTGKEIVRQRKDGQRVHVSLSTSPIYDVQGQVYGIMAALEDITERKRSEEALRGSEARYRELFNSIRDAILVADTDRNIIDCNTAFTELFGYSLEEIEGQKTYMVYHDLDEFRQMGEEIKRNMNTPNFLFTINYCNSP